MAGAGLPLVGRDRETAALDALLDDVCGGAGRLLLVSGDPGIGKSRLLAELEGRAAARGGAIGSARALESVRTAPFALLAEAAEPVLGAPLTDWMAGGVNLEADPQVRDDFFEHLGSAIAERVAERPAVLVLDDLHWADTPTLRFLEWQAAAGVPPGLLVAGSYRVAAVQRGAPLTRLLGAVADAGAAERIELEGLDADAVAALSSATVGHSLAGDALADLLVETQGNPLFVVEVARAHQAAASALGARRSPPLPGAVRESVYGRLDALGEASVAALGAAAVLGGEFDVAVLATMLGADQATVLSDLAAAERAALVQPATGARRYSFTHPLLCRVIYDDLTGSERAQRHLAAARAINALSGGQVPAQLATMAYHYARAVPVGEVGQAIDYANRAAAYAMANLAFEDAARFYGDALDLAEQDATVDNAARAEMRLRRADALLGGGETKASRVDYAEAAELAAAGGDGDRLARGALGRAGYRGLPGVPDLGAIALLESAMALPAEDPLLRARVSARLAMELYYLGERERRDALSADAVDLVRASGDGAVLAQVLISRHYAIDEVGNVAERSAVAEEAARLAEAAGDGETAMLAHYLLVRDHLEVADRHEAVVAAERLRELARTARQPLHPWRVLLLDGLFAHLDGDLDRAEALATEAYEMASAASIPNAAVAHSGLLLMIRLEQGRLAEGLPAALDGRARYPRYSTWPTMVAWCQLEAGDEPAGRATFAEAMAGFDDAEEDEAYLPTGWAMANVTVALGDREAGARLLDRLEAYADRVVVVPGPTVCVGPLALPLGRVATMLGRWADARDHLRAAAAIADRLASPIWTAHVADAFEALDAATVEAPAPGDLTSREIEVLNLIAQGLTNREVAGRLQLGVRTIDSHVATMYRKVGARRRADAVAFGVTNGLVDPPVA